MVRKLMLIISASLVGAYLVSLFFFGITKDVVSSDTSAPSTPTDSSGAPFIEVVGLTDDIPLVGGVVMEWYNGDTDATALYKQYSSEGRIYNASPMVMQYGVYDIPNGVEIIKQELKYSVHSDLSQGKTVTIGNRKRRVVLERLFTGTTYYYCLSITLSDGQTITALGNFKTAESPRVMDFQNLRNIRDIGGWKTTDGKRIKQGILYRGCELDAATVKKYSITQDEISILTNELGIKTELDLRPSNLENLKDVLGDEVEHKYYYFLAYMDCFTDSGKEKLKNLFRDLANPQAYPVYLHCSYGADRTGTACYFLEAVLGMKEEDLYREWELSILCNGGAFYEEMEAFLQQMESFPGENMQEKAEWYLRSIGVTQQELDTIKEIFLEEA